MAAARGLDISISATTDRRAALRDCDAVLSSFRPGGFQARALDERIPLDMGVLGQETQGPGGFFMALRAIAVLKELCAEMEEICPDAWIFNYTNPVNLVAEAATHHSPLKIVSLCEGPIYFVDEIARVAELERSQLEATMVGLNHGCWSVEHTYRGEDAIPRSRRPGSGAATTRRSAGRTPGCCTWRRRWARSRRSTSGTTTTATRSSPSWRPGRPPAPRTS